MKKLLYCILSFFLFLFASAPVMADYVLPYPSYMPGNKLYTVSKVLEKLESYWYWGAIGQTKYHMMLADKYLVEAKTLFEYKQYPLAIAALEKSDEYIAKVPFDISWGKRKEKDMSKFESMYSDELTVHRQLLSKLKEALPKMFVWTPEKQVATTLDIEGLFNRSITIRSSK